MPFLRISCMRTTGTKSSFYPAFSPSAASPSSPLGFLPPERRRPSSGGTIGYVSQAWYGCVFASLTADASSSVDFDRSLVLCPQLKCGQHSNGPRGRRRSSYCQFWRRSSRETGQMGKGEYFPGRISRDRDGNTNITKPGRYCTLNCYSTASPSPSPNSSSCSSTSASFPTRGSSWPSTRS